MVEVKVGGGRAVTSALKANEEDDGDAARLLQDPFEEPPVSRKRPSFTYDEGQSATTGSSNSLFNKHWQLASLLSSSNVQCDQHLLLQDCFLFHWQVGCYCSRPAAHLDNMNFLL